MPSSNASRALALVTVGLLALATHGSRAATAGADGLQPARAALLRLMPALAPQFTLTPLPRTGPGDSFRVSGMPGAIRVAATSNIAALYGVNWYLRDVAHRQISPGGDQLRWHGKLPAPPQPIERNSPYRFRYALNENTDGYSTPYWDWPRWEREIDLLAFSGINAVLVERGTEAVYDQTFRDFGYAAGEIRRWITQPAHQNWQWMSNLCCFNEPISAQLLARRAQSARQIIARLRELGITPVLPGYFGIIPDDFAARQPGAHVIAQGDWNGFRRPAWLDPRDPRFAAVAASFYRHQRALFGDTSIYDMEAFQEGGTPGNVPLGDAAKAIQQTLELAHPGALWMMLAWQDNPSPGLLAGVDRDKLLIVDIEQGRTPHGDREVDFRGAPYLFGGLWEFGGRTTLGANLYDYAVRLPQMAAKPGSTMAGTAFFCEGLDTNPAAFTLFTEMAWRAEPVDLLQWSRGYALSRYGGDDPHATRAWQILMQTVYGNRADGVAAHGERDSAPESLFAAQPSLTATTASTWAPDQLRYDPHQLQEAFAELLQASAPVRATETYHYDLVDIARQVLANWSREALPQIKDAYDRRDAPRFHKLAGQWLHRMDLDDALLATDPHFLLGPWLNAVHGWASTPAEAGRLQYDARSILTTWGDRTASEAGLHDYGNKDWSGLVSGYYRPRWQRYFAGLEDALRTERPPEPIDWFAWGEHWNRSLASYPVQPHGDAWRVASQIAHELALAR